LQLVKDQEAAFVKVILGLRSIFLIICLQTNITLAINNWSTATAELVCEGLFVLRQHVVQLTVLHVCLLKVALHQVKMRLELFQTLQHRVSRNSE